MVGALVVFLIFLYFHCLKPTITKYQELNIQIDKSKRRLLEAKGLFLAKDRINEKYSLCLSRIKSRNSEQKDKAVIMKELQGLMKQVDLNIIDMKPGALKNEIPFRVYYVKVKAEGTILQMTEFLYNLNKSSLLLRIEQIQIVGTKDNCLQFQFSISSQMLTD